MRTALRAAPGWGAALLWGAFVPAALFATCLATPSLFPLAVGIALVHAVGLGLPVALVFLWRRWIALPAVLAAGFAIGFIPAALLAWPPQIDHLRSTVLIVGAFGALGAAGAGTFWLVLRACGALPAGVPPIPRLGAILAVLGFCADVGGFVFL